jgi:hypothetical protein
MDAGNHLQAADPRHLEVYHHQARFELRHAFEAPGPIFEDLHAEPHLGQDLVA